MDIRKLIRNYTIASYKIDGVYAKFSKRLGFNESDLCLFYALYPDNKLSQKQICNEWQIPKTTLNTALKKYQKIDYLEFISMPNNHKELLVCLSEKGRTNIKYYIETLYKAEERAMRQVLELYDEKFIEATNIFANLIEKEFKNIIGNL